MCSGSSLMFFLLGNFVWALKDENVYNGSLFKQNNFLEKLPTTLQSYRVMTAQRNPYCIFLITPRTENLEIY